jgi:integrase
VKVKNLYLRHQTYLFQLEIPPALRDRMGKRNIKINLGKDIAKATVLTVEYRTSYKSLFAKMLKDDVNGVVVMLERIKLLHTTEPDHPAYEPLVDNLRDLVQDLEESKRISSHEAQSFITAAERPDVLRLREAINTYLKQHEFTVGAGHHNEVKQHCEMLYIYIGDVAVETITKKNAGEFIQARVIDAKSKVSGKPLSLTSKRKIVKNLSSFFYNLTHMGLIDTNPFANMTRSVKPTLEDKVKKPKRPWADKEIVRILEHSQGHHKFWRLVPVIKVMALTGMRLGEVWQLRQEDVDTGVLTVHKGKNKNALRTIPIHPELITVMPDFFKVQTTERKQYMTQLIIQIRRELEMEEGVIDAHSFRRFYATQLEQVGTPEHIAASILGHSKSSLSFNLYSGGPLLGQMKEWIEKTNLPHRQ